VKIHKHPDTEEVYSQCYLCSKDILVGDKFTRLIDGLNQINLHDDCYEPYIAERFQKRPMIAGVSNE